MIWFGTPKNVIKKDISEYDLIRFNPNNLDTEKLDPLAFEIVNSANLFGLYYIKFDLFGKIMDSAIFEAILYDPLYYASILKETGHTGCFIKKYPGYFDNFRRSFEQTKKEFKRGRY